MRTVLGILLFAGSALGQRSAPPNKPLPMPSDVMQRRLVREVPPEYPAIARQRHIYGIVTMEIRVSTEGRVTAARTISGHPLLIDAALDAVRQWIYRPVVAGGAPVEVVSIATVTFPPDIPDGRKGRTILHPALLETSPL